MSFIYLASPYSAKDAEVVRQRFELAEKFTAQALRAGINLYSPIVHNHELAAKYDLPKDFDFWCRHNYAILAKASQIWVLQLSGYEHSVGVTAEIEMAETLGIEVRFIDPFDTEFLG